MQYHRQAISTCCTGSPALHFEHYLWQTPSASCRSLHLIPGSPPDRAHACVSLQVEERSQKADPRARSQQVYEYEGRGFELPPPANEDAYSQWARENEPVRSWQEQPSWQEASRSRGDYPPSQQVLCWTNAACATKQGQKRSHCKCQQKTWRCCSVRIHVNLCSSSLQCCMTSTEQAEEHCVTVCLPALKWTLHLWHGQKLAKLI